MLIRVVPGNTCDDANDANGCIFTLNLLVEDATPDEIDAAVADVAGAGVDGADGGAVASADATATDTSETAAATITASATVM